MKSIWISLVLLSLPLPSFLESEIDPALAFLTQRQEVIEQQSQTWNIPPAEVLAIVAPELIRYELLRDFMESQALEIAYLNFGTSGADFSIGPFQMKPSFIEKIENYLVLHPELQDRISHTIPLPGSNEKANRHGRLARLNDFTWQLHYAAAFYQIGLHRFASLQSMSPPERIAFLAAAYNYGFDQTAVDIHQWQEIKAFPYGKKYTGPQASYAEVALTFYHRLK